MPSGCFADAARALLDQGADIITQHTDSPAALQAAEERGVYAFGQATDMSRFAPKAHLTAIEDNWGPYYVKRVQAQMDGTWEPDDVWLGMADGEMRADGELIYTTADMKVGLFQE